MQEKQFKELQVEHKLQKDEKDKERKLLSKKIETMLEENKVERKKIEDAAWHHIDEIKDANKEELVTIIEAGMLSKSQLTDI